MRALHQDAPDLFTVELGAAGGPRAWLRQLSSKRVSVDPYSVGKALKLVMAECDIRSVSGARLLWNEYKIFLSSGDYERLKPLEAGMRRELHKAMSTAIQEEAVELEGPLKIEFLVDQEEDLAQGTARVRVAFVRGAAQEPDPESTMRVGQVQTQVSSTERIYEPSGPSLQISWIGGSAQVFEGERVVLGRPHDSPQGSFVPLSGATARISRRHIWVEYSEGAALIGRLPDSNPVQVNGRLIQAGGSLQVEEFPLEISLSTGELVLKVQL